MLRVWIDDERPMPDDFNVHVRNYSEFCDVLCRGEDIELVSFDHDLGEHGNAYEIAKYIEEEAYNHQIQRFNWEIHSANPVGAKRIRQALEKADSFWNRQDHPLDDWQYLEDLWDLEFVQENENELAKLAEALDNVELASEVEEALFENFGDE